MQHLIQPLRLRGANSWRINTSQELSCYFVVRYFRHLLPGQRQQRRSQSELNGGKTKCTWETTSFIFACCGVYACDRKGICYDEQRK